MFPSGVRLFFSSLELILTHDLTPLALNYNRQTVIALIGSQQQERKEGKKNPKHSVSSTWFVGLWMGVDFLMLSYKSKS